MGCTLFLAVYTQAMSSYDHDHLDYIPHQSIMMLIRMLLESPLLTFMLKTFTTPSQSYCYFHEN